MKKHKKKIPAKKIVTSILKKSNKINAFVFVVVYDFIKF